MLTTNRELNGYDAGTYDLPGAFWNARVKYKF
jgi:hypothetical protein